MYRRISRGSTQVMFLCEDYLQTSQWFSLNWLYWPSDQDEILGEGWRNHFAVLTRWISHASFFKVMSKNICNAPGLIVLAPALCYTDQDRARCYWAQFHSLYCPWLAGKESAGVLSCGHCSTGQHHTQRVLRLLFLPPYPVWAEGSQQLPTQLMLKTWAEADMISFEKWFFSSGRLKG